MQAPYTFSHRSGHHVDESHQIRTPWFSLQRTRRRAQRFETNPIRATSTQTDTSQTRMGGTRPGRNHREHKKMLPRSRWRLYHGSGNHKPTRNNRRLGFGNHETVTQRHSVVRRENRGDRLAVFREGETYGA